MPERKRVGEVFSLLHIIFNVCYTPMLLAFWLLNEWICFQNRKNICVKKKKPARDEQTDRRRRQIESNPLCHRFRLFCRWVVVECLVGWALWLSKCITTYQFVFMSSPKRFIYATHNRKRCFALVSPLHSQFTL